MSRLEDVANVVLRVPSIVLLDLLYRWDVEKYGAENVHLPYSAAVLHSQYLWVLYCLGHVMCAVLLLLPLRHLVNVFLYLLTALLLYVAHQAVRDYVRQETEAGLPGAVYEDETSLSYSVSTLTGLVIVCTLCSLLMRTRQAWLFSAPVLPPLARLAGLPPRSLPHLLALSTAGTLVVMCYAGLSGLRPLCALLRQAYQEVTQEVAVYRLVAIGAALWTQLAVPILFLVFWLVLFLLQVCNTLSSKPGVLEQQGALFIFLSSVSECCGTPYCLLGLTFTVSYLALAMLNLCKFYLMGHAALHHGNAMHRGVTEGVTLMLLSLQTGLLELQVLQRTFLLSIIFFIVVTSTLQSMMEIAHPILLALAATGNRKVWRHVRGLSLCLFLLLFPSFMAYKIAYFFHMDFWLLILVSSCLLTSLQVLGTLFIYTLFMMELFQDSRVERMDEIIYGVNAISRVLEFLVALCVVAYGTWESIFGEWSWMGVSVIIVHSYFNVWLRAQSGWRSFLLRREAARKISYLPQATEEQLRAHSDVCAICFQEMSVAVITTCGHFFHADCLKKWLYIQDTCPLCHQLVRATGRDNGREEYQDSDTEDEVPGGEGGDDMQGAQTGGYGDRAEQGKFVQEGRSVVEESASLEVEEEHQPEEEDLSCRGLESVHHKVEQVLYKEFQRAYKKEQEEQILCRMEEDTVLFKEEQDEAPCREVEEVAEEVPSWKEIEDEIPCRENGDVLYRKKQEAVQVLYREPEELAEDVICKEVRKEEVFFSQEQEVLYKDCRKAVQVLDREAEEIAEVVPSRKEQEEIMTGKAVQVLYREAEEVSEEVLSGKEEEEVLRRPVQGLYKEAEEISEAVLSRNKEEEVLRRPVQVLYREAEEVSEEVLSRKKEEEVLGRPVQVLYREAEEVSEEVLSRKEQEKDLKKRPVQVLYREAEEVSEEVLCRKDHEEGMSGKAVQVLYREAEEVVEEVLIGGTEQITYREAEELSEEVISRKEQEEVMSGKVVQVLYREEEMVSEEFLSRNEQEEVMSRKVAQIFYREEEELSEEDLSRKEQEEIPSGKAIQVLYAEEPKVLEDLSKKQQEKVMSGKEVHVSYREEEEPEEVLSRKVQEERLNEKAVQTLYKEAMEVSEEVLSKKEQEKIVTGKMVQVPYREEKEPEEVLSRKERDEVLSGKVVRGPYREEVISSKAVQVLKVEEDEVEEISGVVEQQKEPHTWADMAGGESMGK